MFVFSEEQLKRVLSSSKIIGNDSVRILDIGSGDGHVTDRIRAVFKDQTVHVTETSTVMKRVLKRRDYK